MVSIFSYTSIATHGFQLLEAEQALCVASCTFGNSTEAKSSTFYVVGTAIVTPSEKEPKNGRILVFQVTASKWHTIKSTSVCTSIIVWLNFEAGLII